MTNLFEQFSNISTTYMPNSFQLKYPCNQTCSLLESTLPNKPYEIIKNGELVGYFWYQGDSVELTFELSGSITLLSSDNYITVQDIANSLLFDISIFDFRGARILEYSNNPVSEKQLVVDTATGIDNATITLLIDAETSSKLVKGVYKLELVASHVIGYRETLFTKDSAMFEVR